MARPLAERGFQVLIQSTRGTFGSGGTFDPMRREREDGLATLDWVVKQPWFGDSMVLVGASYLGYVQWAVADSLPPQVKAMIPQITESALTLEFLRKDALSLETPFGWGCMVAGQERRFAILRGCCPGPAERPGAGARCRCARPTSPPSASRIEYIQDVLAHDADAPAGPAFDHRHRVARRDRAGQLDRRLVRHLPARPAPRLPGAAGRRPPGPADRRAVDAPVRRRHGRPRGPRVRAGPRARRGAAAAQAGAPVRDGRGGVARLRLLAACRLRAPALPPPARRQPGSRAARGVGARRRTATTRPTRPPRPAACAWCAASSGRVDNTALEARPDVLHLHHAAAGRGRRGHRRGRRRDLVPLQPAVRRRVRPALRRRRRRSLGQRLRRAGQPHRRGRDDVCRRSRCGRRRTGSRAGTASASRSPAARSRATPATPAPANPTPPPPTCAPPTRRSSTTPAHPSAIILPVRQAPV